MEKISRDGDTPSIFMNITEILRWDGPVTGIQRVALNLLLELNSQIPSMHLVRFDIKTQEFFEYDKATFLAAKTHKTQDQNAPASLSLGVSLAQRTRNNLKVIFRWLKYYLPAGIRDSLIHWKRKTAENFANLSSTMRECNSDAALPLSFPQNSKFLIFDHGSGLGSPLGPICESAKKKGLEVFPLIYDLIPYLMPQMYLPDFTKSDLDAVVENLARALRTASAVVTISECAKRDIAEFCRQMQLAAIPIHVIRLGDDLKESSKQKPVSHLVGKKFFLFVSTLEPRKNHKLLLEVWKLLEAKLGEKTPLLVFAGRAGWFYDDVAEPLKKDKVLKKYADWLFDTDDDQLAWLYSHCQATLYPSLYEGWGLPVAESLARGKPCFASNTSSIPEIGGTLVRYFDPKNPGELAAQLLRALEDEGDLRAWGKRIGATYRPTSWKETSTQLKHQLQIESN